MKDIQKRAGCVEELETNKAQIPVLQFWQCLVCGSRQGSPPQLYVVFAVVKQRLHSHASWVWAPCFIGHIQCFTNFQLVITNIHKLEKAFKNHVSCLLLKNWKMWHCQPCILMGQQSTLSGAATGSFQLRHICFILFRPSYSFPFSWPQGQMLATRWPSLVLCFFVFSSCRVMINETSTLSYISVITQSGKKS